MLPILGIMGLAVWTDPRDSSRARGGFYILGLIHRPDFTCPLFLCLPLNRRFDRPRPATTGQMTGHERPRAATSGQVRLRYDSEISRQLVGNYFFPG
jgi:hypothetical protein